ncbi:Ameloblastin [Plecturocebus cupreus]
MVMCTCNLGYLEAEVGESLEPALWEVKAVRLPEVRSWRPAWPMLRNSFSTRNTKKLAECGGTVPVIPATREAEAGESLEPGEETAVKLDVLCGTSSSNQKDNRLIHSAHNKWQLLQLHHLINLKTGSGQVWWLMPLIPALWEVKSGRSPEVRSLRPAWPTWGNPISTKNTKKISRAWWCGSVILTTQEAEIPLFKMKDLILILGLLEMSFAVPLFPQQPGTPGMASLSLEYSRFGFGKSFNSLWMHGLLPPHSSFPWMRPREHETQQYEYSLPVHPPPLPSQPSLKPQQPGLKPFLQSTAGTANQATAQKGVLQPPIHLGQLLLQEGELPPVEQQVAPSDKPPKPEIFQIARLISRGPMPQNKQSPLFPGMFYMPFGANQLNAPARLGIMSSEEMAGGRGGPMGYGAMFPGFEGMRPSFGGMPHNTAMGGDFTLEFDSPVAATKGPEKGEVGAQGSPMPEANPDNPENPAVFPDLEPAAHAGLLALPKDDVSSLPRSPSGKRMGPLSVTPAATDPLMTPELADVYGTYGADMTTSMDFQEETTMDTTMAPNSLQTSVPGNKAQEPKMMHDAWHFQEP